VSVPDDSALVNAVEKIADNGQMASLPNYLKRDLQRVEEAIAQHTKHEDKMVKVLRQLREEGSADISEIDLRLGNLLTSTHDVCSSRDACFYKCDKRIFASFELRCKHDTASRKEKDVAHFKDLFTKVDKGLCSLTVAIGLSTAKNCFEDETLAIFYRCVKKDLAQLESDIIYRSICPDNGVSRQILCGSEYREPLITLDNNLLKPLSSTAAPVAFDRRYLSSQIGKLRNFLAWNVASKFGITNEYLETMMNTATEEVVVEHVAKRAKHSEEAVEVTDEFIEL
jgi:hypothetical protein